MDTMLCSTNSLRHRDITLDPLRQRCTLRGEPIPLTNTEFAILRFLMENKAEHGFGLPAVQRILQQMKGELVIDYSEPWFQVVAEIPNESIRNKTNTQL